MTEEPFKIPHYAALLRFLHFPTNGLEFPESFGKQVLDDLWKAFQAFLDKLMWREVRLFVRTFPLVYLYVFLRNIHRCNSSVT